MKKIDLKKMENLQGGKISCIAVGVLSIIPFYALAFAMFGDYERCFN